MNPRFSRRRMMQAVAATASAPSLLPAAVDARWPLVEGPNTPKICLGGVRDGAAMRRLKQIGVDYAIGGGGRIPWREEDLRSQIAQCKAAGITLYNLMISGFNDAIYARPGRDRQIEMVQNSIRAAGRAGLPVVEYNWYAHRAM